MKILVTGGAGFIGSHVVDGYISEGHEVIVIDNLFTGKRENINPEARFYLMDVRSDELRKVFEIERPDIVNHHAAQMSVPASVKDPVFDADVNVLGLINLLQCCVRYQAKKIIFISSGGAVYGESDSIPTEETYSPRPLSPYGITKLASEYYLNFFFHHYGIHYTVLRYANIYGPRQVPHAEAGVVALFMNSLISDEVPTIFHYPDEPDGMTRDYCFVNDVRRANVLSLDRADSELINIGTATETTTGELYRVILDSFRKKGVARKEIYDFPNKGPARPGDLRRSCLDADKAGRALNWYPEYSLKRGIEETLEYYVSPAYANRENPV